MICAKIDKIIAAMTSSCLSPTEIAKKAGVSVNIVYRMRFNITWTSSTERAAIEMWEELQR